MRSLPSRLPKALFAALLLWMLLPPDDASAWWDGSWKHRRKITIVNSGQPSTLVDFPVLIRLDSSRVEYTHTQNAGQDIRFVDSTDTMVLAHEIELWKESGSSYVWVRAPQIDASSTTGYIWMYYDNPAAFDGQNVPGVWNPGYGGVWHLKETPPAVVKDSTGANHGTPEFSPVQTPGQIDGSLQFDGTTERDVLIPHSPSLSLPELTVSGWVRLQLPVDAQPRLIVAKWKNPGSANYWLGKLDASSLAFRFDAASAALAPITFVNDGAWHHVAGVAEAGGNMRIYVDGVQRGTSTFSAPAEMGTSEVRIGRSPDAPLQDWNGGIDEVRIENVARSADWIRAEYLSMRDAFVSIGTPESQSGAVCCSLGTSETASTLTVTSPGLFEMRFNRATGAGVDQYFDLADDPGRVYDLAGGLPNSLHTALLGDVVNSRTSSANTDGARLHLLEATTTRTRVRQEAFYQDLTATGFVPALKGYGDYSLYPAGRLALAWERRANVNTATTMEQIRLSVHMQGGAPLDQWRAWGQTSGPNAIPFPGAGAGTTASDHFVMAQIDQPSVKTDFLSILSQDWAAANHTFMDSVGVEEQAGLSWRDTDAGTITPAASQRWNLLTYVKPTDFSSYGDAAVATRAADYRTAATLSVATGTHWNDASENTAGDDFNEAEAAYLLNLDPAAGLKFQMTGSLVAPRYQPFFKLRQWRSLFEPVVTLQGQPLVNDVDYKADVKPLARAHFAQDLTWYSTLQDATALAAPIVVGSPGTMTGVDFPAGQGRFGDGARFNSTDEYITIPTAGNLDTAQGAIELWYRPAYDYGSGTDWGAGVADAALFGYWISTDDSFHAYHEPGNTGANGLSFMIDRNNVLSRTVLGAGSGYPMLWRANDWVHLRFVWRAASVGPQRLDIYVNGVLATPSSSSVLNYADAVQTGPGNFYIGDRHRNNVFQNPANGIIDEFRIYSSPDAPKALAHGGLMSDATEYLADPAKNFQLGFIPSVGLRRGQYLYLGGDGKFRGLNVSLAIPGAGTADLKWQYWDGSAWADLDAAFGFTDGTNDLKASGTISWTDPPLWARYSLAGGPELYYVRAYLASGNYTTPPKESRILTDILLFQYCGNITDTNQEFVIAAPTATEVDLTSFTAVGLNGAVELSWETASETDNLGFYLYRATSSAGPFELITPSAIPGLGSSPVGARYRYLDQGVVNDRTYSYLLEDYETTGKKTRHGPVSATPQAEAASPPPVGGGEPPPLPSPGPARITYGNPDATSLRIIERTPQGLLLELTTGGFLAESQPDGSVRLSIPGFTEENAPGSPAIPTRRAWIEAVAGKQVRLTSVRGFQVAAFSSLRPLAAEARELVASRSGALRLGRRSQAEGRPFRRAGLYPGAEATLLETAFQGETKKVLLELAPLRFDPRSGRLLLTRRLQVRLSFAGVEPAERSRGGARGRRYEERRSHRRRGVIARFSTRQKGLYAVRYEDIAARGGLEAAHLALSRQGSPVAFHLEPDRRRFGPGSVLYFWSEGASVTTFGPEAVYELEQGDAPGLVMPIASAAPGSGSLLDHYVHRLEREENLGFAAQHQIENLWVWASLLASTSKSFPFEASRVVPGAGTARLELWLVGISGTPNMLEHRVRLFVNGSFVAEPSWTSVSPTSLSVELDPTLIQEGTNTLLVENANSFYSAVMVDRFAVSYPRLSMAEAGSLEGRFSSSGTASVAGLASTPSVLDISSPVPRWLAGARCWAGSCRFGVEADHSYAVAATPLRPSVELASPSRLKDATNQYDYLVIGPQAMLDAAAPLIEQRQSQGLASLAVPIEEVFDEFGFGEPTPQAIRDFLGYAFQRWAPPAPRYVLLLGDGSFDYKDYLKKGTGNPVPPVLFKSSSLWTASDPLYAAVNGQDSLPDLALGRLPASTPEEARAMVDKILAFENAGLNLDGAAVLVSDNPDSAGNFDAEADELASGMLASRNPSRIALAQLGRDATRAAVLDAFAQGPSLLSFLGHGSQQMWAHENIFHANQVPSLAPQVQLPFVLTMNCLNGYFHYPHYDSLSEELVKAESRGAIAAFSPSGLSFDAAAQVFHKAILAELAQQDHARLGDVVLAAQAAYADTGASPELIDMYHLFGDPALKIR